MIPLVVFTHCVFNSQKREHEQLVLMKVTTLFMVCIKWVFGKTPRENAVIFTPFKRKPKIVQTIPARCSWSLNFHIRRRCTSYQVNNVVGHFKLRIANVTCKVQRDKCWKLVFTKTWVRMVLNEVEETQVENRARNNHVIEYDSSICAFVNFRSNQGETGTWNVFQSEHSKRNITNTAWNIWGQLCKSARKVLRSSHLWALRFQFSDDPLRVSRFNFVAIVSIVEHFQASCTIATFVPN